MDAVTVIASEPHSTYGYKDFSLGGFSFRRGWSR